MKEKSTHIDKKEIFTIETVKNHQHPKFKSDSNIYFTIMLYYAAVFTVSFWLKLGYEGKEGLDINFGLFSLPYIIFVGYCFKFITIPSVNHLSETEAINYMTGSPECQTYVKVKCYHTEGGTAPGAPVDTAKQVTIYVCPFARLTNLAIPNKEQLSVDLHTLLSKTPFLLLAPILHVTPADDECKKHMDKFRNNCIANHSAWHRDTDISATFLYKLLMHGKQVDNLVVFTDGTTVPQYWLGRGGFCLMGFFLAVGFPLAAVFLLIWKMNTCKILFKKQIHLQEVQ